MPSKWSILSKLVTPSKEPNFSWFLQTEVLLFFNFLSYSLRKIPFHFFPRGIFYTFSFFLTAKYVFLNSVFIHLKTITWKFQDMGKKSMHPHFTYWKSPRRSLECSIRSPEYNFLIWIHHAIFYWTCINEKKSQAWTFNWISLPSQGFFQPTAYNKCSLLWNLPLTMACIFPC